MRDDGVAGVVAVELTEGKVLTKGTDRGFAVSNLLRVMLGDRCGGCGTERGY